MTPKYIKFSRLLASSKNYLLPSTLLLDHFCVGNPFNEKYFLLRAM